MKYLILITIIGLITSCVPVSQQTHSSAPINKSFSTNDRNYESSIGMVQLFPTSTTANFNNLEYPVIALNDRSGVTLEFDLLQKNADYVNVRFIHCNSDWTRSNLNDIQFLKEYNEFPVNQYNFSANTRIPYVNYSVQLPTPTKSGNYVIMAYRDSDKNDLLLSRRLLVFDQRASVDPQIRASTMVSKRDNFQQIEFGVRYEGLPDLNPLKDIKVSILQNHNWTTAVTGLQPTLMRQDEKFLEYEHFNGENNFAGWKEFRFFDLRSIDFRGMSVSSVLKQEDKVVANLGLDKSRKELAYSQINEDINGNYYLQNRDPNDTEYESEYVQVNFDLMTEEVPGDVYITGMFNNWNFTNENKMVYNATSQSYQGSIWLKQGYYNYQYWVKSDNVPEYELEGSHYQTFNDYEILVYYRNPFNNFDELIGYRLVSSRN
ncbi:MAG: DUF5103 domain-containing protein [Marinoscillum sp.]